MKQYLITVTLFLFWSLSSAQTADCVEGRYTSELFTNITESTVQYGKNININTTDSLDLLMDIYTPTDDSETSRPVLILAHGGSFIFGNRSEVRDLCIEFAQRGYVTASISYHLWPLSSGVPDSLQLIDVVVKAVHDMKGAVRYFKNDQATDDLWNVDSTRIVIGGYSAGAILALHASHMDTTDTNIPEFILENVRLNGGIEGQANKLNNTSDVIGTVNLSGALYDRNFIDTEDPPFISFHGDADGTVPFARGLAANIITMEGSSLLHQRADEIGLRNRFDAVSGGGHTDIYTDAQFEPNRATFFRHVDNFVGSLVCPDLISRNTVIPFAGEVAISPNPASTSVSILFEKELFDVDISVYNLNGQLIQFKRNNFGDQVNLDVSKLSKGIYLVELVDQVGGTEVQKLVIK